MLFAVARECLLKLFKLAAFVMVEKKLGNNAVGTHVLLSVQGSQIQLIATDLDVELITTEYLDGANITVPGEIVVPFRKLNDVCRAIPENTNITISVKDDVHIKLSLKTDRSCFAINCLNAKSFPVLEDKRFHTEIVLGSQLLRELIGKVIFAVGDDEGRHFLNGVFISLSKDGVFAASADGHRLMIWESFIDQQVNINIPNDSNMLIPKKSSLDILKILGELGNDDVTVKLSLGNNHFRIVVNDITYTSKLLAAAFPSFKKLIPQNIVNTLTISKESFKSCLMRAAALLGDREQAVKLIFTENGLQMIGSNDKDDSITETVAGIFSGQETQSCFNIKYLLDFLSHIDSETVVFKINDAKSGALIQDVSLKGSYVLMPMQI
jgi:DNA polymerase III subunit beta